MSKLNNIDGDGFQKVTSKKSSKNKQTRGPQHYSDLENKLDINKVLRRIQAAVEELKASSYFEDVLKSVSSHINSRDVIEIVCFGLGSVGECTISWYQTALLLCLIERFTPSKALVHDPIFTKSECDILKQLGLGIIHENKEGAYIISDKSITIAYFPHCPKQLTNNFLWSNWNRNLQNCVLLCNSFTSLVESNPSRILDESVPYIHNIFPHTYETKLENSFRFTDIFNDTSVHSFPIENLDTVPTDYWIKSDKPKYENIEEFITSSMIEKLNI